MSCVYDRKGNMRMWTRRAGGLEMLPAGKCGCTMRRATSPPAQGAQGIRRPRKEPADPATAAMDSPGTRLPESAGRSTAPAKASDRGRVSDPVPADLPPPGTIPWGRSTGRRPDASPSPQRPRRSRAMRRQEVRGRLSLAEAATNGLSEGIHRDRFTPGIRGHSTATAARRQAPRTSSRRRLRLRLRRVVSDLSCPITPGRPPAA